MRDPEGERLGNRLFIGEAAPGPLSLELPVQIGWQPNRCFKRRTGAHTTRLLKFGIFLQNANAGRRVSRFHPASRPSFLRERLCSSFRTTWNLSYSRFIRSQSWMQGVCSEFRTERRSNAGCGGIFAQVRGPICDTRARSPERPALLPGVCRPDRCVAAPKTNHRQLNIIIMYFDNNSGDFAILLLANHWYLLYKV
jgi:hypothetical protein